MQLAWSRVWPRVAVSISYDDNHYTTGTSKRLSVVWRLYYFLLKYVDHSLNKGNFARGVGYKKHCLQKSQHHLLYRLLSPELFLYRRVRVLPFHGLSFWLRLIYNHFFTKTCFSVHIPHSSVNCTRFVLFSPQKIDDRPLFEPGSLCFICSHFESSKNK